jgi:plasmid stabilization system protein ParE
MARKGKVIWTETARSGFRNTCTYWNKRNASNAYSRRLRKLVQSALDKIILFPKSGVPSSFEGVRFVVVRDYLLFYQESRGNIILLSFWDGRQHPEKLDELLT